MNPQPATDSGGGAAVAVLVLFLLALYFLPTVVALLRKAPDRGTVIVLNLFLGWTLVGWVSALAIASRSRVEPFVIAPPTIVVPPWAPSPPVPAQPGPPAGWYPAPEEPGLERFWDGLAWTSNTRRAAQPAAHR